MMCAGLLPSRFRVVVASFWDNRRMANKQNRVFIAAPENMTEEEFRTFRKELVRRIHADLDMAKRDADAEGNSESGED